MSLSVAQGISEVPQRVAMQVTSRCMSPVWPFLGVARNVDGFVEPMAWGRATYTVVRLPAILVDDAARVGTRRVAGRLGDLDVNLAITRAPVIPDAFVWAGSSLLRRMRLEPGDPVSGHLAPVDPDHVPLSADLAEALAASGLREAWEMLTPPDRRRRMAPVDAAATSATRARRLAALIAELPTPLGPVDRSPSPSTNG